MYAHDRWSKGPDASEKDDGKGHFGETMEELMFKKLLSFFEGEGEGGEEAEVTDQQEPENLEADFDALIKGKYKEQYDARFQKAFNERHKDYKQTKETLDGLNPMLDMLKSKYGVQDTAQLQQAIMDDDSYYEQEAMERGYTVEQLKEIKRIERENAEFKRMQEQAQKDRYIQEKVNKWVAEADAFKQQVPDFDFRTEMRDPSFQRLLENGVPVAHAYQVIHMNEIMTGGMQYAAQKATERTVKSIQAKGTRPDEIGLSTQRGNPGRKSVSDMSGDEILEMAKRAKKGESITL